MTDLPPEPPTGPPPETPAGADRPGPDGEGEKMPGFFVSTLYVLGGLLVLGAVSGALESLLDGSGTASGIIGLAALLGVIVWSIRDRRVGTIVLKGCAVVVALGVVLVGACFAMVAGMYS